jgi:hypothetical protein
VHAVAAKAVSFKEAMAPEYKAYQQQVVKNAQSQWPRLLIARGNRHRFRRYRKPLDAGGSLIEQDL